MSKKKYKGKKQQKHKEKKSKSTLFKWSLVLFISAFVLYSNTIGHDFVMDDTLVIKKNNYVQQGIEGISKILSSDTFEGYFGEKVNYVVGSRYRPLSLVSFAIEKEIANTNPAVHHFFNIFWYALTGILIFIVFNKLLKNFSLKFSFKTIIPGAFIIALIFLFHPVHTEVVANIKGRDEIFALLGALLGLSFSYDYVEKNKIIYLFWSGLAFFAGLMSKENTITFLAIIPIALYFFSKTKWKKIIIALIPLVSVSVIFLIIRFNVIGGISTKVIPELMNDPFLNATTGEKYATIIFTLGYYIKLLFVPHPLTYDYYPYHIELKSFADPQVIISLILYIALIIYALWGLIKKHLPAFGVIVFLIALSIVSNLFFPVGVFMAERFLYMSSLGFCIVLAWFVVQVLPNKTKNSKNISVSVLILLLIFYGVKTIDRNKDWKNNFTLFTNDIKISENSAKGNTIVGETYLVKAKEANNETLNINWINKSIPYFQKALKIHPKYEGAWLLLGDAYRMKGDYKKSVEIYDKVISFKPKSYDAYYKAGAVHGKYLGNYNKSLDYFYKAKEIKPNDYEVNFSLGTMLIKQGKDYDKAIEYLKKAQKMQPDNYHIYKNLGGAFFYKRQFEKALNYFNKALSLKPGDKAILKNIEVTKKKIK